MLSSHKKTVVLGSGRLRELREDMQHTIMPSWIGRIPWDVGSKKARKLSADQWRLLCSVHLVITLVRLWGPLPTDTREHQLLENFMHLAAVTVLVSYRSMTFSRIKLYVEHLLSWLHGTVHLFPGISLESNQHMSLHMPTFLFQLGPTHAWRAFAYERWNHELQLINTNMHFGKLHFHLRQVMSYASQ